MRSIEEILKTQRSCKPGNMAVEICDLMYKIRHNIELTAEEEALKVAYLHQYLKLKNRGD